MTTLVLERDPCAVRAEPVGNLLTVTLDDGRIISVPLDWYPRLLHASSDQRNDWELIGDGEGIHWPQIDEDLSVAGLLRGTPAQTLAKTGA